MYCIKCGVELADSEKRCPLCGTPVFHPDLPRNLTEPPYPADRRIRREDVNRSGILFVTLPSGRKLSYIKPRMTQNRFGRESLS